MRQGVQSVRVRSGKPCIGWKPVRRRAASEGSLSLSVRSASALRGYRGAAEEGKRRSLWEKAVGGGRGVLRDK